MPLATIPETFHRKWLTPLTRSRWPFRVWTTSFLMRHHRLFHQCLDGLRFIVKAFLSDISGCQPKILVWWVGGVNTLHQSRPPNRDFPCTPRDARLYALEAYKTKATAPIALRNRTWRRD